MIFDLLLILYFIGTLVGLWMVFKKAGLSGWKALVPIWNIVLWVKLCGKDWKWIIYALVPAINIFTFLLLVVETAKCYKRYGFWEQTFAVIFPWIYLPLLGFSAKMEYTDPKEMPPHKVGELRDWLDAIVFAVVAAVIIRGGILEFYNIPSSSMEKSLLTGDYLMVSKIAYGPRTPMTPLSFPLVHNVMPLSGGNIESYLKWIKLPYHRFPGFRHIERFDAVVFNYPDGDTVCTAFQSNASYHDLVREFGREQVWNNPTRFGKIVARPVDKKENFIKRCIGLPGEDLQIVDQQVLINGKAVENPEHLQFTYGVLFNQMANPHSILSEMGVSEEDWNTYYNYGVLPLTSQMYFCLKNNPAVALIEPIVHPEGEDTNLTLFPHAKGYNWSVDNFGPVHIPSKGETLHLDEHNLPLYRRVIVNFEHNTLEVKDGIILINGQPADSYTFKMDYYWMMGDNRHNSADSRYWGFVPEDHVVGRASRVVFSRDKDRHEARWNRVFLDASSLQ